MLCNRMSFLASKVRILKRSVKDPPDMIAALGQTRSRDVWFVCFSYLWLHCHGSCGTPLSISTSSSDIHLWDEQELKMERCVSGRRSTFLSCLMGVGVFAGSFFSSLHAFAFARLQGGPQTQRPHEEEPLSGVCHQELQLLQLRPLQQQAQVGSGPPTEG